MKALILVGGFGTRLRPLTWTRPKPLVPFANRPMVLQQVAALKKVGVTEVILAVNYQSEMFDTQLAAWTKEFGIKFTVSLESQPMGTAGPLALARSILEEKGSDGAGQPFFVLNSDVVVAFEEHKILEKMIEFHKSHKREGTMLVTKVSDPTKYGVVVSDKTGQIQKFVEKPKDHSFGDCINAGIYLLNPSVLNRIPLKPTSIERETFPAMVADGQLFSQTVTGFWMDIGQPKDYLIGMEMFLNDTSDGKYAASKVDVKSFASCGSDVKLSGNVLIDRSVNIGSGVTIGPNVIIGRHVVIGNGVTLERCTLMDGVRVEPAATVRSSIIGFNCLIGEAAAVRNSTFGDAVVVNPKCIVDEAKLYNEHTTGTPKGLKALILVGGFGTRLRPLTWTRPKPLVPFANRPMVLQQVAALKKVGVTEVILAVNYQSEMFDTQLAAWTKEFGIKFTVSLESQPMGTAGPLALARSILEEKGSDGAGQPFFVLNSDVVVAFEEHKILEKMIEFHKSHKREGTMLVTKVSDPTKYGVVVSDKTGQIQKFVEKPKDHSFGDCINAGIYLLNPSVLNRIPLKPTSIERETFPAMVADGQLFSQTVTGFWMDIGQPKDYLIGMEMFLNDTSDGKYAASKVDVKSFASCGSDVKLSGNVLIDRSVNIGSGVTIGPNVIIGRHVVIGNGVTLERCTLMDGVRVEPAATVRSSIIGFNCLIGEAAAVRNSTFGDAVVVNPKRTIDDAQHYNEHTPAPSASAAAAPAAATAATTATATATTGGSSGQPAVAAHAVHKP